MALRCVLVVLFSGFTFLPGTAPRTGPNARFLRSVRSAQQRPRESLDSTYEYMLVTIPRQKTENESSTGLHQLRWNSHKGVNEFLELHA